MSLQTGSTLGNYRITDHIGAGGMGEVYRAEDTRLRRTVAIKMLPFAVAHDPVKLARFEREARMLAAINHPNIAGIYGLEEHDGLSFLIMEFVPGDTLLSLLRRGPVEKQRALETCRAIAAALEAAHEQGIVHRDLKPSNVMLTPDGEVKLLDFGLAKARHGDTPEGLSSLTTREDDVTDERTVLGTVGYMSPEQVRGQPLDQRSDIWAFGCVMYECLSGKRAFAGATHSDVSAAVLTGEPDWVGLEGCPERIASLVQRCLNKPLDRRLHSAADARIEIDEVLEAASSGSGGLAVWRPLTGPLPSQETTWRRVAIATAILAALAIAVAAWSFRSGSRVGEPSRRLAIDLAEDRQLLFGVDIPPSLAISPDGTNVAYVAGADGRDELYVRALDSFDSRVLPGTLGARAPFFSPDGEWLAYFAAGKLMKTPVSGGGAVEVCDVSPGFGGAWGRDGTIVFVASFSSGLQRVDSEGGDPEPFTRLRPAEREQGHHSPAFLPDGRSVLFTVWQGGSHRDSKIAVQSLEESDHRIVLRGGSHPTYTDSGHLVYARGAALTAGRFDSSDGRLTTTPRVVLDEIQATPYVASPMYALSAEGTLVYVPPTVPEPGGRLVWLSEDGTAEALYDTPGPYNRPRRSPDGEHVAFHTSGIEDDVWTFEIARGTVSLLTRFDGWDGFPVWSPDGTRIAFATARDGPFNLFSRLANGGGEAERLLPVGENLRWPTSWSADGRWLAYTEQDPATGNDIWLLDLEAEGGPTPQEFLRTTAAESWAVFHPAEEWILYESTESGRHEIWIRHLHDAARQLQISPEGGARPMWAPDGRAVYYVLESRLMRVDVTTEPRLTASRPRPVTSVEGYFVNDVHGDGGSFLAVEEPPLTPIRRLHIVLSWLTELD